MPQGRKKEEGKRCPGGHALPREGCTPMYCLEKRGKKKLPFVDPKTTSKPEMARKIAEESALGAPLKDLGAVPAQPVNAQQLTAGQVEGRTKEAERLALMAGRFAARHGLMQTPTDLKGGDAEEFAQRKLVDMLPAAVTELEFQLHYGDDKQRQDAARDVLDANGMRRKESATNMVPPIVLNFNGTLPWLQQEKVLTPTGDSAVMKKVQERAQVIDGEATRSESSESGPHGDGP